MDNGERGIIEEYLKNKKMTCALDIWRNAFHKDGNPKKWESSEINTILDSMKDWERMSTPRKFDGLGSQRGYKRKLQLNEKIDEGFSVLPDEKLENLPF